MTSTADSKALDFDRVFDEELKLILEKRRRPPVKDLGTEPHARARDFNLVGLALSGGGIRSASFNLGVLQALRNHGILERCDYLSTVSGGGYIGSCFSSLCAGSDKEVSPQDFPFGFNGTEESAEVRYLRSHSKFLAPRHGLFNLDTWMLVAAYLRGLLLSLLTVNAILGAAAAAVILVTSLLVGPGSDFWVKPRAYWRELFAPAAAAAALWLVLSMSYLASSGSTGSWTIRFREGATRWQARALGATIALAVVAALPLLLAWVHVVGKTLYSSAVGVSALSLARSFVLGEKAKSISASVTKVLVAVGSALFVVLVCFLALYAVWLLREQALLILGVLVAALLVMVLFVNINRVSMYYFYRDRLSRAFLIRRPPNKPQDVESNADMRLSRLAAISGPVPYHLINATINLVGSKDEQLHGRKADLFLYSGLFCGSRVTGYQRTEDYLANAATLASAMAVSGAALNPQYGSRTRPALGFLMALLNVRLGAWAKNPAQAGRAWRLAPWPWYLALELLSLTNERHALVDVSDGGHIENLGVYELLRRQCRVIIACDAGADPERTFGDLGNVIRKARIDMGIDIQLDVSPLKPTQEGNLSTDHIVVGKITYPPAAATSAAKGTGTVEGTLVYVKTALTRGDPVDLHEYRSRNPAFPQESTADQFFDEAQFESYRELGYQSGKKVRDLVNSGGVTGLALRS